MKNDVTQPYAKRGSIEPIFHPQMRKTREVIRRPEWVKHSGEAVAHRGSLNSVALFGILFANCVGGGYGFEDGIGSAGPLITLIVCIVLPWLWALPTGLAVAELSTAVPSNSGVLMWANAALPPFISFLCILATILITFIGNATYPSLTSQYVNDLVPLHQGEAAGVKIAVIVLCCVLNCVGVEIVGNSSIILCAITILPFFLMTAIQLFGHGFNAAVLKVGNDDRGLQGVQWAAFFSIISWNYANIENAGAVVEEIANPRKALPKAMIMLMFGTYVGYVMPMLAGVSNQGIGQDYTQWQAGHWPQVAKAIAGDWLKYMLFAGAMLSGVGFTLTNMCCTSRLLAGMGTMEMFHKKISRVIGYYHPRLGTPIVAILINSAVTTVFSCALEFGDVVSLCQSLYCMRMLVIYAAVVKLRVQYPKLPRPYALPCNTWLAALCLAPAAAFSLMCAIVSAMTSLAIGMAFVGFVVGGCGISWLYCRIFARNGFQGVIVQCVVSDDEENFSGGEDDADGDGEVLDEGVFYHDGEDDVQDDTLLGILPMTAAAASADGTGTEANAGSGKRGASRRGGGGGGGGGEGGGREDGSMMFGTLPDDSIPDGVISSAADYDDGRIVDAEYVAREENIDGAHAIKRNRGGDEVAAGGRASAARARAAAATRRGDDGIDVDMQPIGDRREAAARAVSSGEDEAEPVEKTLSEAEEVDSEGVAAIGIRNGPEEMGSSNEGDPSTEEEVVVVPRAPAAKGRSAEKIARRDPNRDV